MKCRDCNACHKGYFKSKPDVYVCTGVAEPFVISDINNDCTEYKYIRDRIAEDGVYIELFAVKDGVRHNYKIVSMRDVSAIFTNNLMNGIEELCK